MGDPHLLAIAPGPAGARHLAVGRGDDRRAPAGAEIDPLVHPRKRRIGWTRMPKPEVIRALTGQASALDETCVRLSASIPAGAPADGPFASSAIGAPPSALDPGVEQRPALLLAGRGAAVGDDQVEAVVGAKSAPTSICVASALR